MKRALVTGASGAIGAAIARALARDGHFVYVHANQNAAAAQALAAELIDQGCQAEAIVFDLQDAAACAAALAAILSHGPIQILVNNAGTNADGTFAGMGWAQWASVIDVNLHGFYRVTQPLILPMARTRWGRIVNLSSVTALMGNRGQVNYAAAKAGLHGATRALALELASRAITVNTVAPGIIESAMTEGVFDAAQINALVPAKRAGRPEEVAALVRFLCSEEAGYISGQCISINGGMA